MSLFSTSFKNIRISLYEAICCIHANSKTPFTAETSIGNRNYSADIMGDSYEFLIKKFADLSKKNAGEFYTPRPIVKLMVDLLDPQPGETVYDPACGTGGMLIEAIHHMHNDRLA